MYYSKLVNDIGISKTKLFLDANLQAIEEYKRLSKEYSFDFEEVSSYKYSNDRKRLEEEMDILGKLGYKTMLKDFSFNNLDVSAIEFSGQGQMNPMKLIEELSNAFEVYEHSMVTDIKGHIAYIKDYKIKASKIIITTGYPFFRWHGGFFMKLTQNKSHVLAFKTKEKCNNNGVGSNSYDLYFRSYNDYLLVGGNDIAVGKIEECFKKLEEYEEILISSCG